MTTFPAHILYIDDDADILLVARLALEKIGGFRVTTAGSGREGIALARRLKPDVMMLDVMMPENDGPAVLKSLRRIPALADIPVIFTTARVQRAEIDRYRTLGVAGVIPKPFSPVQLPEIVLSLWNNYQRSPVNRPHTLIDDLRERYLDHLSARQKEIEALCNHFERSTLADHQFRQLLYLVHNLIGSGKTYGYPDISRAARAFEDAMGKNPGPKELAEHSRKLLRSMSKALHRASEAS